MSYHWGTERRLNAYSDYFRSRFGGRVQKITLDAGFTCPNRDGTCGTGGCTFCDNRAFNPAYNNPEHSIGEQIRQGMEFHRKRYRRAKGYLAYFQAYSNTHGALGNLVSKYNEALSFPGILGLVIGTRPDCVDAEKLDYLAELSRRTYVVVEYGIESVRDKTLKRVNRGHDVKRSEWAVKETAGRGIRVGGHLIIGLPGEKEDDFLKMADLISTWPLNNVKFHQLQVIRGTVMETEFMERPGDFIQFEMESYLELMVRVVERLNPDFVVERIAGEIKPGMGISKGWGVRYDEVLREFEALLEKHNTWQGKHYMANAV
jgi:hypothetical protein